MTTPNTTHQFLGRTAAFFLPSAFLVAGIMALRWMLMTHNVWFGEKECVFVITFLMTFAFLAVVLPLFIGFWLEKHQTAWVGDDIVDSRLGPGMLLAGVIGILMMGFGDWSYFSGSAQVARAKHQMTKAAQIIGRTPATETRLKQASRSYQTYLSEKAFVDSIAQARTGAQDLTLFLVAAQSLNAPSTFVRENGIIRKEDEVELLNLAVSQPGGQQTAAVSHWMAGRTVQ